MVGSRPIGEKQNNICDETSVLVCEEAPSESAQTTTSSVAHEDTYAASLRTREDSLTAETLQRNALRITPQTPPPLDAASAIKELLRIAPPELANQIRFSNELVPTIRDYARIIEELAIARNDLLSLSLKGLRNLVEFLSERMGKYRTFLLAENDRIKKEEDRIRPSIFDPLNMIPVSDDNWQSDEGKAVRAALAALEKDLVHLGFLRAPYEHRSIGQSYLFTNTMSLSKGLELLDEMTRRFLTHEEKRMRLLTEQRLREVRKISATHHRMGTLKALYARIAPINALHLSASDIGQEVENQIARYEDLMGKTGVKLGKLNEAALIRTNEAMIEMAEAQQEIVASADLQKNGVITLGSAWLWGIEKTLSPLNPVVHDRSRELHVHNAHRFDTMLATLRKAKEAYDNGSFETGQKLFLSLDQKEFEELQKLFSSAQTQQFYVNMGLVVVSASITGPLVGLAGGLIGFAKGSIGAYLASGVIFTIARRLGAAAVTTSTLYNQKEPVAMNAGSWLGEMALASTMFGVLGKSMQAYEAYALSRMGQVAAQRIAARQTSTAVAGKTLSEAEYNALLTEEVAAILKHPIYGDAYKAGAFAAELAGFTGFEWVVRIGQIAWEGYKQLEEVDFDPARAASELLTYEAWKDRFIFLAGLKAGGWLTQDITDAFHGRVGDFLRRRVEVRWQAFCVKAKMLEAKWAEFARSEVPSPERMIRLAKEGIALFREYIDILKGNREPASKIAKYEKAIEEIDSLVRRLVEYIKQIGNKWPQPAWEAAPGGDESGGARPWLQVLRPSPIMSEGRHDGFGDPQSFGIPMDDPMDGPTRVGPMIVAGSDPSGSGKKPEEPDTLSERRGLSNEEEVDEEIEPGERTASDQTADILPDETATRDTVLDTPLSDLIGDLSLEDVTAGGLEARQIRALTPEEIEVIASTAETTADRPGILESAETASGTLLDPADIPAPAESGEGSLEIPVHALSPGQLASLARPDDDEAPTTDYLLPPDLVQRFLDVHKAPTLGTVAKTPEGIEPAPSPPVEQKPPPLTVFLAGRPVPSPEVIERSLVLTDTPIGEMSDQIDAAGSEAGITLYGDVQKYGDNNYDATLKYKRGGGVFDGGGDGAQTTHAVKIATTEVAAHTRELPTTVAADPEAFNERETVALMARGGRDRVLSQKNYLAKVRVHTRREPVDLAHATATEAREKLGTEMYGLVLEALGRAEPLFTAIATAHEAVNESPLPGKPTGFMTFVVDLIVEVVDAKGHRHYFDVTYHAGDARKIHYDATGRIVFKTEDHTKALATTTVDPLLPGSKTGYAKALTGSHVVTHYLGGGEGHILVGDVDIAEIHDGDITVKGSDSISTAPSGEMGAIALSKDTALEGARGIAIALLQNTTRFHVGRRILEAYEQRQDRTIDDWGYVRAVLPLREEFQNSGDSAKLANDPVVLLQGTFDNGTEPQTIPAVSFTEPDGTTLYYTRNRNRVYIQDPSQSDHYILHAVWGGDNITVQVRRVRIQQSPADVYVSAAGDLVVLAHSNVPIDTVYISRDKNHRIRFSSTSQPGHLGTAQITIEKDRGGKPKKITLAVSTKAKVPVEELPVIGQAVKQANESLADALSSGPATRHEADAPALSVNDWMILNEAAVEVGLSPPRDPAERPPEIVIEQRGLDEKPKKRWWEFWK